MNRKERGVSMDRFKKKTDENGERTSLKIKILEDITLIPMGAARLRISAFPVTYE